jgi:hypothetical protein
VSLLTLDDYWRHIMSNVTGADVRSREHGAVSLKVVFGLVLVCIVAFMVVKLAPVYIEQQKVVHDVNELARIAAVRGWKEDRIAQDIKRLSVEYNLPDNGINFVSKTDKGVLIAVNYQRTVDLLVTEYSWKVDHTSIGKDL